MTTNTIKAINLFSRSGNLAQALCRYFEFILLTSSTEKYKEELEKKKEVIKNAEIIKMAYNINKKSLQGLQADAVIALIHTYKYQFKEHEIPERNTNLFPAPRLEPEEYTKLKIHRLSIYECQAACDASNASEALLFFTYNPFQEQFQHTTMKMLNFLVKKECFVISGKRKAQIYVIYGETLKRNMIKENEDDIIITNLTIPNSLPDEFEDIPVEFATGAFEAIVAKKHNEDIILGKEVQ